MDLSKFNNEYWNYIREKLLRKKNKHIILIGNFNVDVLKHTTDTRTAHFLDHMYSSFLLAQIPSPTHLSTKSKALIDNISSIDSPEESISRNIITSKFDHLTQFLLLPKARRKKKSIKGISKTLQEMN